MQFNTRDGPPSTWDRYGIDGNHDGTKDIYDPADAIPSAANYLRELLRRADGNLSQAILGYNHSQAYVNDVLARARRYAGETIDELATTDAAVGCSGGGLDVPVGPANLQQAERLTAPRAFRALPTWAMAAGRAPQLVDARIHGNVVWILRRYHLRVTAARESGHHTHGDGTAVDLIPADGTTQPVWDASAGRLAQDLGWTPGCARSAPAPPARSRPRSSSSATTATPATARPAPAPAPAPPTSTSPGPPAATAQAPSRHPATGSARFPDPRRPAPRQVRPKHQQGSTSSENDGAPASSTASRPRAAIAPSNVDALTADRLSAGGKSRPPGLLPSNSIGHEPREELRRRAIRSRPPRGRRARPCRPD